MFSVQVYTKPLYYTSIHTTSLLCKCTQNQSTVQMYKKVGQRDRQTDFNFNNERNVQGRNITKEYTGTEHYQD